MPDFECKLLEFNGEIFVAFAPEQSPAGLFEKVLPVSPQLILLDRLLDQFHDFAAAYVPNPDASVPNDGITDAVMLKIIDCLLADQFDQGHVK